jgi:hypothetical protein
MKTLESVHGKSYYLRDGEHQVSFDGNSRLEFRIVDRADGEKFVEIHRQELSGERIRNHNVLVNLNPEDVRYLASAFVEMSARLLD